MAAASRAAADEVNSGNGEVNTAAGRRRAKSTSPLASASKAIDWRFVPGQDWLS
jgi:hypothetical protein